ncbi:hypothetical protein BGZ94_010159, partial [Podila epigama]
TPRQLTAVSVTNLDERCRSRRRKQQPRSILQPQSERSTQLHTRVRWQLAQSKDDARFEAFQKPPETARPKVARELHVIRSQVAREVSQSWMHSTYQECATAPQGTTQA